MNTYLPGIRKETKTLEYFSPCDASSSCVINSVRLIYVYDDIPEFLQKEKKIMKETSPIKKLDELIKNLSEQHDTADTLFKYATDEFGAMLSQIEETLSKISKMIDLLEEIKKQLKEQKDER